MDRRNSFECHYCKAYFGTLKELDHQKDTFHDSSDSERESISNNMIEDVYYREGDEGQEAAQAPGQWE